jgi:uncharacterized phiE125 gp8 family phage protein
MKIPHIVVEATTEPLSLAEARLQCRVDPIDNLTSDGSGTHPDDDLLLALITAARENCENFLGLSLVPKTLEIALDEFPGTDDDDDFIELPMGPVSAIVSVTAGTGSDSLMDPADYVLDTFSVPNRLVPATTWPSVTASVNTVRIIYTVGYDGPTSSDGPTLPKAIIQAMKLLVADWYKHREDTDVVELKIPNGVNSLLRSYRIRLGMA